MTGKPEYLFFCTCTCTCVSTHWTVCAAPTFRETSLLRKSSGKETVRHNSDFSPTMFERAVLLTNDNNRSWCLNMVTKFLLLGLKVTTRLAATFFVKLFFLRRCPFNWFRDLDAPGHTPRPLKMHVASPQCRAALQQWTARKKSFNFSPSLPTQRKWESTFTQWLLTRRKRTFLFFLVGRDTRRWHLVVSLDDEWPCFWGKPNSCFFISTKRKRWAKVI